MMDTSLYPEIGLASKGKERGFLESRQFTETGGALRGPGQVRKECDEERHDLAEPEGRQPLEVYTSSQRPVFSERNSASMTRMLRTASSTS
jgi:hypothetical protein